MYLTQSNTLADVLRWEEENNYSREKVTIKSGQNLAVNTVIGKITKSTPTTGAAVEGNTGNGTCTSVTAGSKTKLGIYTLTALSETSFAVKDPDGFALPNATVGAAYTNEHINFTLNAGSPAFAEGDAFTITVAAGSGQVTQIDFDAVDGSQDAYGITIADYDATSAAVDGVAIVRNALIVTSDLVWPASPAPSAEQKSAALAQLENKGIVTVAEA